MIQDMEISKMKKEWQSVFVFNIQIPNTQYQDKKMKNGNQQFEMCIT